MADESAQVHAYLGTPADDPALRPLLDDVEHERLETFRKPADRARYVAAHALTRLVVSRHAGIDNADVRLNRACRTCGGSHGKPEIAGGLPEHADTWHISLSHSADLVVVAITAAGAVGVDIEKVTAAGFDGFDAVALAAPEAKALRAMPRDVRPWAQSVWWTRKEAVLKATGDGLMVSPADVVISPPDSPPVLERFGDGSSGVRAGMADLDLPDHEGYVGSVAVLGVHNVAVTTVDGDGLLAAARTSG